MRRILTGLQVAAMAACAPAAPDPAAEAEIQSMLEASAVGWNAGNLDVFMASYARESRTTFVGNHELLRGWDAIRTNYAALFEPGAMRDSLRFEDIEIRLIDPLHAIGYARWVLVRDGEPFRSGPFTLVVERHGSDWVILHDHSSEEN